MPPPEICVSASRAEKHQIATIHEVVIRNPGAMEQLLFFSPWLGRTSLVLCLVYTKQSAARARTPSRKMSSCFMSAMFPTSARNSFSFLCRVLSFPRRRKKLLCARIKKFTAAPLQFVGLLLSTSIKNWNIALYFAIRRTQRSVVHQNSFSNSHTDHWNIGWLCRLQPN